MNHIYRITDVQDEMDAVAIHRFLSGSYWAKRIPFETVERAIRNSLCFGVFLKDEQIGFARVVTDRATFAYLADVFITTPHRNQGLSKRLLSKVLAHPDLQGLRRLLLATKDAHSLYSHFGFVTVDESQRQTLMQIWNPDVYS